MTVSKRRRAIPAAERGLRAVTPVKLLAETPGEKTINPFVEETSVDAKLYIPLLKANADEQTVTGVVLQPEVVDGQGDIMSAEVIRKAAHKFLAAYNRATKLGLQHKDFKKRFELLESYTAPQELVIKDKTIKEGSWIMTVKVLDSKIWQIVKEGKITGFSFGGKAKVKKFVPSTIG